MKIYRLITDEDSSTFCHRVSKALSNGWELAGSPAFTFDAVEGKRFCAQAVTKDVPGEEYHEDLKLGDY
ncbi:MAG: DUF1737 domain-containing protein [Pseudomonadota bacterium]